MAYEDNHGLVATALAVLRGDCHISSAHPLGDSLETLAGSGSVDDAIRGAWQA